MSDLRQRQRGIGCFSRLAVSGRISIVRIFLAGATGVIGQKLIPLLLNEGHQVTATTRSMSRLSLLRAAGADPVIADALDRDALLEAVVKASPDVVIHQLTDLSNGDSASNASLRAIGTRNLVDASHAAGVQRIVAQSIAWAYESGDKPANEHTPLDFDCPEPRQTTVSGIVALESVATEICESVILRNGLLYGPGTWYSIRGKIESDLRSGRPLSADNDVSSFIHLDDAVAAIVAALEWPSGPVNICDDDPALGRDWVPALCLSAGIPVPDTTDLVPQGWARGASNTHARSTLGWVPRYASWREGFHRRAVVGVGNFTK